MRTDVIGVGVPAVLVVGEKHLRLKVADEAHERFCRDLDGNRRERVRRQRLSLVGKPGVGIPEPAVLEAHDLLSRRHLVATKASHVSLGVTALGQGLVEDAAALASGATHHHYLDTAVEVVGICGSALARFVVGVRVHGHQAQRHRSLLLSIAD